MSLILRGLLVMATAGALSLPSNVSFTVLSGGGHGRTRPVVAPTVPHTPTTADFKTTQLEYYLGDDGIAYIRPGLQIKVNSITIGADRRPLVDVSFTDDFNQPLDRLGQVTPGAISASMILDWYDPTTGDFTAYTTRNGQAAADSGGVWTDLETGHATYKFKTALPADYDGSKTHTIGIYANRNLEEILGKYYFANVGAGLPSGWRNRHRHVGPHQRDGQVELQQLSRPAHGPWRDRPEGPEALRALPHAADDRSRHREHGRFQSDDPQDP